jgi:hypothetical protein
MTTPMAIHLPFSTTYTLVQVERVVPLETQALE